MLRFKDKAELDELAEKFAREPMDFYGSLCHTQIVVLDDAYGILVKLHHIISDAWTLALIGSQFNSILKGETPETYSYLDYISSEQKYLEGKRYQKDRDYYIEQFKKCDETTYLSDKQASSYVSERKTFVVDKEKTAKITAYADENNTSLFMLLMTALGVYINRIKMNQEKFYVGTAVLNRNGLAEQNTMGMFINTVPILFELENNSTFKENLDKFSENMMTMLRHQKFNYGDVLKTLRSEFDFTGNLYDVMLSYQNAKVVGMEGDFESTWYHCGMETESLAIHIDDRDSEGLLKIHYDYQVEKFTEKEIERMHEHIFNLLFDAINEDKKITTINILSEKEMNALLFDFNDTKADYPKDKCVHQLFEEQVLKTPDKSAVIACDKTLTYDELNKLSNRIANSLIEKNVKANDIIAFALPRNSYLIAVMFGILKSGAAYMPIDPDYPQDRIDFMLNDSNAKFFITESNLIEFIADDEDNPNVEITSDNYCYCIYTSGSTGIPKATVIKHYSLVNYCFRNYANEIINVINDLNCQNTICINNVCFDAFVDETFLFLIDGKTVILANEKQISNSDYFEDLVRTYNIDVISTTPSKFKALVKSPVPFKLVVQGGEELNIEHINYINKYSNSLIFNTYGPTETTVGCTCAYSDCKFDAIKEDKKITELAVLSEDEKNTLLYDFNDTKADYPKDKCVHQLFEEQVLKTPDVNAVIACDKTLTYDELNKLSNRIANSLIEKGVKANDVVAFALPRNSYLIAVMFGILKSGAAYMPIDPDYPQERVDFMLKDSNAKLFITENNLEQYISYDEQNPDIDVVLTDYCYGIYTSGSTGKPKIVCINHSNLLYYLNNVKTLYKSNEINMPFFTNSNVDLTVTSIYLPIITGGCIYAYEADLSQTMEKIIYNENINTIKMTPTHMSIMNALEEYRKLDNVKYIIMGGENLSSEVVEEFLNKYGNHIQVHNEYGPTETTVGCMDYVYNKNDFESNVSIGKPIANTQIYIVDKHNNLMPIGQIGELCIAGDGVGAGYLNRPELTAEKFIDNPFGEGKLYKTGDLAYWREDGNIAYVGRNDFQVKIRGLRIELGEIENAISTVENVLQAVVVVRKDTNGRQLICAFYTQKQEVELSDIKKSILDKLPKYMMPHIFTVLEEMPLTTSGKINRRALPEVDLTNTNTDAEYVKPENKLQQEIASVMEKVLNYSPIGLNDDFFDLGGDSLKAIEFVSKAHSEGIYFNLQAVFDNPTVAKLYDYIENGDKQAVSYNQADFDKYVPLLENNKVECIELPQKSALGNVFITGSTGFLGSHIIDELLSCGAEKVYCLVRNDETRLYDTLLFYFGDKYKDDKRIIPVIGDLEHLVDVKVEDNINFVIHTAASVKHYGSYQYFYDMNVMGTKNTIEFSKKHNAKLIHISTLSVSGNALADNFDVYKSEEEKHFYENTLYIEQPLDNVYIRSKFEAEKVVFDAMLSGLEANIIRVGNLTNRVSDAKFQKNHESNAFLNRFKAVLELKVFPEYLMSLYAEFSPVDDTAKGIVKIAEHFNNRHTVFNLNSYKPLYFDKFVEILKKLGIEMNIVNGKTFIDKIKLPGSEEMYEALINDMDENGNLVYDSNIRILNDFTKEYMKLLGFEWSEIDFEYMKRYVEYFREIGYLEV